MAYWHPVGQHFVPQGYHESSNGNSARTSDSSLPLATDIDPASAHDWNLPLGDQTQSHWAGASMAPQLDLAMTVGVPPNQLMATSPHMQTPFPTGPLNDMNEPWLSHEDPFASPIMGDMQNFYTGPHVVVTTMAPNSLLDSQHAVFTPIQSGMHTPAISESFDAQMERRISDHSFHSGDGLFSFAMEPEQMFNLPMSTALSLPIVPAPSPVLQTDSQQTSYPGSPGSEGFVIVEHPADSIIALRSSEELSDHEALRHKPRPSPPRRRKASTSESSDRSEGSQNANVAGGAGAFPSSKKVKRNQGGRLPGMHLTKEAAKEAREMRNHGSCWRCQLQREKCALPVDGGPCKRCVVHHNRALMSRSWILQCVRTKMQELRPTFFPDTFTNLHTREVMKAFQRQHVANYHMDVLIVNITVLWNLPPIQCRLYEFEPATEWIKRKLTYIPNKETGEFEVSETPVPIFALDENEWDSEESSRWEDIMTDYVEKHFETFAKGCYDVQGLDDFLGSILNILVEYKPDNPDEALALKELFKLMLAVHVFTHSSLIHESDIAPARWGERYGVKPLIEGYYAVPPMANRALKCIYSRIISKTLQSVLERLQRILHGSSKMAKWMMAFCSVLVLGMCLEALQSSIRMNYNDLYRSGVITKQDSEIRAESRCGEIDKSFLFIMTLFRHKFTNSFNFIMGRNPEYLGEDAKGVEFVNKVSKLFDEKLQPYISEHILLKPTMSTCNAHYGRLVARFLHSFCEDRPYD